MPITTSAKKAHRKSERRREVNTTRRKNLKATIKNFKKDKTAEKLALAYKTIDKAAKVGLIKKNTAARLKSRLAVQLTPQSKKA